MSIAIYTALVKATVRRYYPAVLCALALLLCVVLSDPRLEAGLNDDWSYIATAQRFAQTGHIVYNGWATAMLGWQVVFAAAFVRVFGFSFTIVRVSGLLTAMGTALLMQRIFVRCGIRAFHATVGTLAFVLSPLFLPLAFSFMTDVPCLFCTLLCVYGCLRGLQSATQRSAIAWIVFAAVSSDIGGTGRQIAWLGVLVMVPCALWLLRPRRRPALLIGAGVYLGSAGFIVAALHWFSRHPFSIQESLLPGRLHIWNVTQLGGNLLRLALETALLLLPLLCVLFLTLRKYVRAAWLIVGVACMVYLIGLYWVRHGPSAHTLDAWLAPWLINTFTEHGVLDGTPILGERPVLLSDGVRLLLSVLTLAGSGALAVCALLRPRQRVPADASQQPPVPDLAVLLGPFALASLLMLCPRAASGVLFDRYVLTLLFLAMLALLRFMQELSPQLLGAAVFPVLLVAAFSVAATHDAFAMFRARLQAVQQLGQDGVPDNAIDGGFEFNAWAQIQRSGFVDDPHLMPPAQAARVANYYSVPHPCQPLNAFLFPDLVPQYALSFDRNACAGPTDYPAVVYHELLGPHTVPVYVVRIRPNSR